ncbi:DNA/RNA-binding protein KIN17 [Belonocnema kinseyi]|uniref:DNA/RNA-binding protein KIN17 n=1 Tax=Belonocnema kinseyi TaxID=2817044 RepID=UPI00143DAC82|nr:DNA/RNA-binding protein KIN17 [Belonocnema kinseyi]
MGKHEVGTPKYIANKIKAKGLQKLRWFCQMCQKQCRDENGFKCHTTSESHHRQLLLFADNAHKYIDQFSNEFCQQFLELLSRQFGTKRVPANRVYQEYIADREHVHMNATMWLTLTGFVKWLGRSGKCVVDETEKGWFITYIDRDPEAVAYLEKQAKKEKMDRNEEERMMAFIEKQVESGRQNAPDESSDEPTPLIRTEDEPLVLNMKLKPKVLPASLVKLGISGKKKQSLKEEPITELECESSSRKSSQSVKRERSNSLESIDANESESSSSRSLKSSKRKSSHSEEPSSKKREKEAKGWLRRGLVVKIVTRRLGEKYYKAKGVISELVDESFFVGKVKLKSPEEVEGHVVKIDQEHLETVIPAIGREVIILKGKDAGEIVTIRKVRIEDFCVDVEFKKGEILKRVPYEEICKFSE